MRVRWTGLLMCTAVLLGASAASAQVSITGAIAGTVVDTTTAVVPGAMVQLKDEGTGVQKQTVTNDQGAFAFRDLSFGSYEVTISLQGFQTAVYKKVSVESGRTTDLRVTLSVGGLEQSITVEGATPVLERTSNAISSTLSNKAITELPLAGRNAFTFARLVPGAVAQQGNTGSVHYNGMPGGTINPTIDGVNNSSNGFKSGGTSFFGTVPARLGAIEEVTVETAGLGGDAGVTGGVNLKFVTRRGTQQYRGSAFEQYRTEKLNANSFNNELRGLPKEKLRRHDFGGNFGGPIIPGGNKLFFFFNYEQEYIPQTQTRSQTLLTPEAQQGVFRYQTAAGEQRTANLLQIAAQNGFPGAQDPVIANMLAQQASARQYGTRTENTSTNALRLEGLSWLEPQEQINRYPTARIDYHIRPNLALMGSWNRYNQTAKGRRVWPIPGYPIQFDTFDSGWWIYATGLNWTVGANSHNDLRVGVQHSGDTNERGREYEHFFLNGVVNGLPARFTLPFGLSALSADQSPVIGKHYITTISDTFTVVRGNHTYSFGGNFRDTQWRDRSFDGTGSGGYLGLPRYSINGLATGDPAANLFTATNMPGLQTADQAAAGQLYALLTGRISQVQTGAVVDVATRQYSQSVFRENWTSGWFAGTFVQDSWRMTPDFTLNYGLRWEMIQAPFNHTGTTLFPDDANIFGPSGALFQPGTLSGPATPVITSGKYAAKADWVNLAPRIGFAWAPNFESGLLGKVLGTGRDTVIRGGYDLTNFDEGTNMFASTAGNNPGQSQGWLLQPGPGFPVGTLNLQTPLPAFVVTPLAYREEIPQSELTFGTTGINAMWSDLKMGYVQSWNIGVQRLVARNTVLEVRYLGNRSSNVWHTFNLNEVNTIENGFADQFKIAQQNLAINLANGQAGFGNNGLPGQQATPIFDAAFGARGAQAALPANQGYTNATFIGDLNLGEAGRLAGRLASNQTYYCRMVGNNFGPCATRNFSAAGPYAINVFQANPYAIGGNLNVVDDDSSSTYHSMQLPLRRRYSNGITANVNYTIGSNWSDIWADNATQSHAIRTLRDRSEDWGPSPFDVRQVLQALGTYDLPFGRGRRWDIENGVAHAFLGGWTLGGILTAQSGTPFKLSSGRQTLNTSDAGVVLANGHTVEEIQSMIRISDIPNSVSRLFVDPKLVGPDGRANPEYLAPPTTPGQLGDLIFLRGKNIWNIDMSLLKNSNVGGNKVITVHFTITNLLNNQVWTSPNNLGDVNITSQTFGQTNNPTNGARQVYSRIEFKF